MLQLLAITKKGAFQAIHTSFFNTEMNNLMDDRLLSNRPLPINDEETFPLRRQRTTLSQLRSGHYKLLNCYKKRLKQTASSNCPDCGIDPQDVPHLFKCTAYHNDMSPVNYGTSQSRRYGNSAFRTRATWTTDEDGWRGHTTTTQSFSAALLQQRPNEMIHRLVCFSTRT